MDASKLKKISIGGKEFEACGGGFEFRQDETRLVKVIIETHMTPETYKELLEWLEETNDENK